jgi:hypothetical protein
MIEKKIIKSETFESLAEACFNTPKVIGDLFSGSKGVLPKFHIEMHYTGRISRASCFEVRIDVLDNVLQTEKDCVHL